MTTVEEHLEGLRAAGERVPNAFVRSGLLYELDRHPELGPYYIYEPCEPFEVDGIVYRPNRRSPGLLLNCIVDRSGGRAYMNHSHPPTEEELDRWVRTPDGSLYLHSPDEHQHF